MVVGKLSNFFVETLLICGETTLEIASKGSKTVLLLLSALLFTFIR